MRAGKHVSISERAIASTRSYRLMALVQTAMLPVYVAFVVKWLIPTYSLPVLFGVLTIFSALGLIAAAWIPQRGKTYVVHELLAYGASFLFIPMSLLLAVSSEVSIIMRVFCGVGAAYMATSVVLFSTTKWVKRYHLYFQVVYFALFHLAVLVLAIQAPHKI
ncbi:hypothetical protein E6P97_00285 [Patescibacteria group bacterium]|nr:MAG: hypothetical protein E6P97_00285 [Patescibacteria group bacterium]